VSQYPGCQIEQFGLEVADHLGADAVGDVAQHADAAEDQWWQGQDGEEGCLGCQTGGPVDEGQLDGPNDDPTGSMRFAVVSAVGVRRRFRHVRLIIRSG
jgi:hypothetical protein